MTTKQTTLALTSIASIASLTFCLAGFAQQQPHRQTHEPDTVMMFGPTGSELLTDCEEIGRSRVGETVSREELVDIAKNVSTCTSFIAGVNDHAVLRRPVPYCVPDGVGMEQIVRVVRKWLEDNPAELHQPSSFLVERALQNAFPCR